jgi:hypothetical protein
LVMKSSSWHMQLNPRWSNQIQLSQHRAPGSESLISGAHFPQKTVNFTGVLTDL